jgi:TolA-binding protein
MTMVGLYRVQQVRKKLSNWTQFITTVGFMLLATLVQGETEGVPSSLVPETDSAQLMAERLRLKWELEGVESALQSGFLSVADTLSEKALQGEGIPQSTREGLLNKRLQVFLVQGNLDDARSIIDEISSSSSEPDLLLDAFFRFFSGETDALSDRMTAIRSSSLAREELAWFRLLEALIHTRSGAAEKANEAFRLASIEAPSSLLKDQFELIRFREELALGQFDEITISALRESVRSMRGERGGFEAARLLAIALTKAGQSAEAISVLNEHLAMPGLREYNLRSDFLLLIGTIAGPDSARGRLALQDIISSQGGADLHSIALTLLAQSVESTEDKDSFLESLNEWLERPDLVSLADRFLAYKAYLGAESGDFRMAGDSAQELLDRFPSSSFAPNALRMLAYTSWSQTPPRYRTAADFLNQLRQKFPESENSMEAGVLIADCYFLNEDYANASDMYGTMLKDCPPDWASDIFYQRILAEIGAGRMDSATAMLDQVRRDPRISDESIWRAEWNLLDYLRRQERVGEAYQRIQSVLSGPSAGDPDISPKLTLRFRWLQARLTLEAGPPAEAINLVENLMADLAEDDFGADPESLAEVDGHLLLLRGEAQIASGMRDEGVSTFQLLRDRYPDSGASILSYLVESRTEAAAENLVSAQQSLIALVDRFPASEYAPVALWEAALNAEQRGLNIHLQESINILERLVSDYPSHELVYYARLKQGDLARRLNDFPTALLLYERLLAQFSTHPERYRAELSRADCLSALGSEDPDRFDQAAVIYERNCLLPTAPLSIRLEAGFKWAHALRQQDDDSGSEAVYWLLYDRFIKDEDLNRRIIHQAAGRYWMARVLLELGSIQFEQGEVASAKQVYQTILQMNLPGATLAQARLDSLR